MTARGRGRPAGESGTREAIVEAARHQFGELGYQRTTLRGVARAAGVDPRLVLHYFGSKQELFKVSVELPVDPAFVVARVFSAGPGEVGRAAAELMLEVLDQPASRRAVTGLIRAAVSEPEAAGLIRELLSDRILTPVAARVGADRPELRAAMMGSVIVGLVIARYVVALEPLAGASRAELIRALAPVIDHYLTGDWTTEP